MMIRTKMAGRSTPRTTITASGSTTATTATIVAVDGPASPPTVRKMKADSPDSIPSVAATSVASSSHYATTSSSSSSSSKSSRIGSHALDENENEEEEGNVMTPRRLLFRNADDDDASMRYRYRPPPFGWSPSEEEEVELRRPHLEYFAGSEVASTTSTATTIVASRNLSLKEDDDEVEDDEQEMYVLAGSPTFQDDDTNDAMHMRRRGLDRRPPPPPPPEMTMEDPSDASEAAPACHGGHILTPRQLAEIFSAFQQGGATATAQLWSSSSSSSPLSGPQKDDATTARTAPNRASTTTGKDNDYPPPPPTPAPSPAAATTTPREEWLSRECTALKRIVDEDAVKIARLQRAMEELGERNRHQEVDLEYRSVELRIANERIDALKRDKEVLTERQQELLETIHILKREVDRLSSATGCDAPPTTTTATNYAGIAHDGDNEGQALLLGPSSSLKEQLSPKEASGLVVSSSKLFPRDEDEAKEHRNVQSSSSAPAADNMAIITSILQGLSRRLEAVEQRNAADRTTEDEKTTSPRQSLEPRYNTEEEERRNSISYEDEEVVLTDTVTILHISQDPDEVEASTATATRATTDDNMKTRKTKKKTAMMIMNEVPMSPSRGDSGCCCGAAAAASVWGAHELL